MGHPRKAKPPELGGDTGASGINGLREDVEGYGSRKARTNATAAYLGQAFRSTLPRRLFGCANWLNFRWWLAPDRVTLQEAIFCGIPLLCPNCARRRAARQAAKVEEKLLHLAEGFDYWFITLTVKNGDDLAERFQHLRGAFKRLRHRATDFKRGKGAYVELARAEGLLWSFEFTKSAEGWHPHIHMIAALPKGSAPIAWGVDPFTGEESQLRQDWLAVTGDSCITHATPVTMDDPRAGIAELVKYSLKFSDLTVPETVEAYLTLRGRKLMECSGALRGVVLPDDASLLDDDLTGEYLDFLYRWHGHGYTLAGTPLTRPGKLLESPHGTTGDPHADHRAAQSVDAFSVAQGQPHPADLRPAQAAG
jgi:hypothetical protein